MTAATINRKLEAAAEISTMLSKGRPSSEMEKTEPMVLVNMSIKHPHRINESKSIIIISYLHMCDRFE